MFEWTNRGKALNRVAKLVVDKKMDMRYAILVVGWMGDFCKNADAMDEETYQRFEEDAWRVIRYRKNNIQMI